MTTVGRSSRVLTGRTQSCHERSRKPRGRGSGQTCFGETHTLGPSALRARGRRRASQASPTARKDARRRPPRQTERPGHRSARSLKTDWPPRTFDQRRQHRRSHTDERRPAEHHSVSFVRVCPGTAISWSKPSLNPSTNRSRDVKVERYGPLSGSLTNERGSRAPSSSLLRRFRLLITEHSPQPARCESPSCGTVLPRRRSRHTSGALFAGLESPPGRCSQMHVLAQAIWSPPGEHLALTGPPDGASRACQESARRRCRARSVREALPWVEKRPLADDRIGRGASAMLTIGMATTRSHDAPARRDCFATRPSENVERADLAPR